jgi:hypothetical protein
MGRRLLFISGELFPRLFSGEKHYRVIEDEIPDDARIVNFRYMPRGDMHPDICITLESNSWTGGMGDETIPEIRPLMQTLYPKEGEYLTFAEQLSS